MMPQVKEGYGHKMIFILIKKLILKKGLMILNLNSKIPLQIKEHYLQKLTIEFTVKKQKK